ncbi:membrane dipeptidase [Paraliomyxa miuraensis]|uniref:membrane dipeptidase n=1 Tax=Paraliomyxa miuraensis TaxID=376150 RepID=UPI00224FD217|nr:membrane dipeptidase [Paraliomyxa miuraensis]MCX4239416.1 membrane dipeptidase [Paraliomyxa miuraensis]
MLRTHGHRSPRRWLACSSLAFALVGATCIGDAEAATTSARSPIFEGHINAKGKPLRGFVDLHTHPMAHLGFGGKLLHGAPGIDVLMLKGTIHPCSDKDRRTRTVEDALGSCYATHGGWDLFKNGCGDHIRRKVLDGVEESGETPKNHPHDEDHPPGYPTFSKWPKHNDLLHQMMYADWVQRAHRGGLRVMVALAVNNMTLAKGLQVDSSYDDKHSGDLQIKELKRWVERHSFMEIAYSADDLRRIVEADKLAVILGVELDDPGSFVWNRKPPSEKQVREEVQRLHGLGVRYMFPVHIIDNYFGGTAIYEGAFSRANRYHFGEWWKLECARADDGISKKIESGFDLFASLALGAAGGNQPTPNCAHGFVNARGLTSLGRVALDEMMRHGMLIDIDHMSKKTVRDTLEYTKSTQYPLVSGHNGLREKSGNENQRTKAEYQELARRGGIAGVGWGEMVAGDWLRSATTVSSLGVQVALGSDVNGLVAMPGPAAQCSKTPCVVYDATLPRPTFGKKTWNYNQDGVAHYGLVPDFLRDVERRQDGRKVVDTLFNGAEAVATMWGKAEDISEQMGRPSTGGGSSTPIKVDAATILKIVVQTVLW